tara:strand:+ start:284 stop:1627 length:1344 start_codon:yes stop_codon:yes gene_type:complete
MIFSEQRLRSVIRQALLAEQEEKAADEGPAPDPRVTERAASLKKRNPGLSDSQANMLAKAEIAAESEEEAAAVGEAPKGIEDWTPESADSFRTYLHEKQPAIAKKLKIDKPEDLKKKYGEKSKTYQNRHKNKFIQRAYDAKTKDADGKEVKVGELWLQGQTAEYEKKKEEYGKSQTGKRFLRARANAASSSPMKGKWYSRPMQEFKVEEDGLPANAAFHVDEWSEEYGKGRLRRATPLPPGKLAGMKGDRVNQPKMHIEDLGTVGAVKGKSLVKQYSAFVYDPEAQKLYFVNMGKDVSLVADAKVQGDRLMMTLTGEAEKAVTWRESEKANESNDPGFAASVDLANRVQEWFKNESSKGFPSFGKFRGFFDDDEDAAADKFIAKVVKDEGWIKEIEDGKIADGPTAQKMLRVIRDDIPEQMVNKRGTPLKFNLGKNEYKINVNVMPG